MSKRVNLDAVIGMLQRAERFDDLPPAQQAALRAQVTRTLRTVAHDDPDIADVLAQIQDVIGVAEPRAAERMTVADVLAEYEASFAGYSSRQRAAFKAKVSRMGNVARESGDDAAAAALSELTERIALAEEAARRETIRRLSGQLRKS